MAFIRKIKKGNSVYQALVENYRDKGKVKQRVLKYLGKEFEGGKAFKKVYPQKIKVENVKRYADGLVVDKLATELSLKDIIKEYNKELLLLVYSHLIEENLSLQRIEDWVDTTYLREILQIEVVSSKRLYKALDYLSRVDFGEIEEVIYQRLKEKAKFEEGIILDVTDTYLNDKNSFFSDKGRRGKDGKYKKLIQISLAINKTWGFPVLHKVYNGNISNIHILKDMITSLKLRKISKFTVIDRGMTSYENLFFIESLGVKVIGGLRRNKKLEKIVSGIGREKIYSFSNRIKLINTSVYALEYPYLGKRLIIVYNPALEVVRRELAYEYKGKRAQDKYLGYSFLYTNSSFPLEEVVKLYFGRETVERSFKQMKGVLNLRPIRVWLKEHVIAHIRICYLSYSILSLLSYYLKDLNISAVKALKELKNSYIVNLKTDNGDYCSYRIVLKNVHKKILDRLGVVYKI